MLDRIERWSTERARFSSAMRTDSPLAFVRATNAGAIGGHLAPIADSLRKEVVIGVVVNRHYPEVLLDSTLRCRE